jgi:hypothetical protein
MVFIPVVAQPLSPAAQDGYQARYRHRGDLRAAAAIAIGVCPPPPGGPRPSRERASWAWFAGGIRRGAVAQRRVHRVACLAVVAAVRREA